MPDYLGQSILAQVTGRGRDPLNDRKLAVSDTEIDQHLLDTLRKRGGYHSASSLSMGLDRSVTVTKVAGRLRSLARKGLVRRSEGHGQSDWELVPANLRG